MERELLLKIEPKLRNRVISRFLLAGFIFILITLVPLKSNAQYSSDLFTGETVSASTAYYSETLAFDDNETTHWSSDGSDASGTQIGNGYPEWIKYDFGAGNSKTIVQYRILTDAENDWTPDDWEFQASNNATLTLNSVGAISGVLVDAVAPRISSITRQYPASSPTNADVLIFRVTFNEDVVNVNNGDFTVSGTTGTITLVNPVDASTYDVTISGGDLAGFDGTVTLRVFEGQNITDLVGNALTNLTPIGTIETYIVDNAAPTVTSVDVPVDASFGIGQNLDFTINFNENVTVSTTGGTPQMSITVGATTRQAVYQSGSGTSALLFSYTVQAGELDADGITVGNLTANGGTLKDAVYYDANLVLNSVGVTSSVLVDAVAPTVASVDVPADATYIAGADLEFTINLNEAVSVVTAGGIPQMSITVGSTTRQAIYLSGSGTGALSFRYTVQPGDLDADGIAVGTLTANGGTIKDAASNDANLVLNSVGATNGVLVDAIVPTVVSVIVPVYDTYIAGEDLDFTINFSENVNVVTAGGTPQMSITVGATMRQAVYQNGSGTGALLFSDTVQAGDIDTDGIAVGTLAANGGTLRNAVLNNANLTLNSVGATSDVLVDAVAPTVTSVDVPVDAIYLAGEDLDFIVNLSENVTVSTTGGTPQMSITVGATMRQAVYISGSGTSALLFSYTVQAGELDIDGIALGTLVTNGGTLRDAASNDATLTLNNVGATSGVLVDAVPPIVISVNVPADASYGLGQDLYFTINFSENVNVVTTGGTPQMSITVGSTTRQAVYISGSGTGALSFRYTVQVGGLDADGIAVGTLTANGGTLKDAASNDANLTLNSVGATSGVLVDANPTIAFNTTSSSGLESVSSADLQVDLSTASASIVTVDYIITGTATNSGTDYTLANGILTIAAGNTTANITIASIVNDAEVEGDETVIVTLSSPSNATLGTNTVHTYTIADNDATSVSNISKSNVTVYPNPCTDNIYFDNVGSDISHIMIYDLSGQTVLHVNYKNEKEINVKHLTSGVFLLSLEKNNGRKQIIKIVKE